MYGKGIRNKTIFISLHISCIVPKTWGKWLLIVWENYEKTEHSKFKCFLHILWEAEIHTISKTQNMEKVDFQSMGKHKHFKFMGFLNIPSEAEMHTVPKTWRKWISIVWEKSGKTQTFQSYEFLKYFGWYRNP